MNRDDFVRAWEGGNDCARPRRMELVECIVVFDGGHLPAGAMFAIVDGAEIPSNAIRSAGQALSRTMYAALFRVIGTTYGHGDGVTTFNVPDRRCSPPEGRHTLVQHINIDGRTDQAAILEAMKQPPVSARQIAEAAEQIARKLVGDVRKGDCDIVESHIRELLDISTFLVENRPHSDTPQN